MTLNTRFSLSAFVCVSLWLGVGAARAQEVEGRGQSGTAVFSPADYIEIVTPITRRVAVNTYGFYLGNVRTSVALLEVPIQMQKHLTLTPSYLFVNVPPTGLELLTNRSAAVSYRENQFRLAGTVSTGWHGFAFSDRNMYVRRFTPAGDVNRYRNRVTVAHPFTVGGYQIKPFVFEEVYHDFVPGPWLRRNWVAAAIDMPINRHLTFQPSYIRQDDQYLRSVDFLGLALIIRTNPLFHHKKEATENANSGEAPTVQSSKEE